MRGKGVRSGGGNCSETSKDFSLSEVTRNKINRNYHHQTVGVRKIRCTYD